MFVDFTKPGAEGYIVKDRKTGARISGTILQADDEEGWYSVSASTPSPYQSVPPGLNKPTRIWQPITINRIARRAA